MMKFEYQGQTYKLYFSHPTRFVTDLESRGVKFSRNIPCNSTRRCTECSFQITEGLPPKIGISVCYLKDNFCKSTGRRKAMARLLRRLANEVAVHSYATTDVPFASKSFRKAAWEAYFEQHPLV